MTHDDTQTEKQKPDPIAHAQVLIEVYGQQTALWITGENIEGAASQHDREYWQAARRAVESRNAEER